MGWYTIYHIEEAAGSTHTHSWFIGFIAGSRKNTYVCLVLMDRSLRGKFVALFCYPEADDEAFCCWQHLQGWTESFEHIFRSFFDTQTSWRPGRRDNVQISSERTQMKRMNFINLWNFGFWKSVQKCGRQSDLNICSKLLSSSIQKRVLLKYRERV